MRIIYYLNFRSLAVYKCEAVKETNFCYFLKTQDKNSRRDSRSDEHSRKVAKDTADGRYFNSFEEAKQAAILMCKNQIIQAQKKIVQMSKHLNELEKSHEPEESLNQ